jgi:hypothetical protein
MCAFTNKPPPWAVQLTEQVTEIQKGIRKIMALVEIDQADLDTLATSLEAVKTSLATEIASLGQQLPAADLSGLNQALTDLQGLEAPAPAPSS